MKKKAASMMKMPRYLFLIWLDIKAFFHRLSHDFGQEISAVLASLILLATFVYVFNDFLNVQIAGLSHNLREMLGKFGAAILLSSVCFGAAKSIFQDEKKKDPSTKYFAWTLGETAKILSYYGFLRKVLLLVLWHVPAWIATYLYLVKPRPLMVVSLEFGMILLTFFSPKIYKNVLIPKPPKSFMPSKRLHRPKALFRWRFRMQLFRSRYLLMMIGAAMILCLAGIMAYANGGPFLAPMLSAFLAGVLLMSVLAISLRQDLRHVWMEHILGVSHDEFIATYAKMAWILSAPLGLLMAAACFLIAPSREELMMAWKPAAVLILTPALAPYLLFQIDPRKPAINILGLSMIGLFLATAIFAHALGVILPFLVKATIEGNQKNRFHRTMS